METYIDPVTLTVEMGADLAAHPESYPLKLGGIPVNEYLVIEAAETANEDMILVAA